MSHRSVKEYCKLDTNGRFKLPNAIKKQFEGENEPFVIKTSVYSPCLELWTASDFDREIEKLTSRRNIYDPNQRRLLRKFQESNTVELDASDRIVIPPEQRSVLGNGKQLVLQRVGSWIEIWDQESYEKETNSADTDFAALALTYLGSEPKAE